jgi:Flavodoxin-like fold
MWNFGLPYKLKQLIDLVAQRNYLFAYDGKQYSPLLNVEKAVVVYTRGLRFLEGTPLPLSRFDHQATYLGFSLRLVGVRDLRSVIVDNWFFDGDRDAHALNRHLMDTGRYLPSASVLKYNVGVVPKVLPEHGNKCARRTVAGFESCVGDHLSLRQELHRPHETNLLPPLTEGVMPTSSRKSRSTVLLPAPATLQSCWSGRESDGSVKSASAIRSALGSLGLEQPLFIYLARKTRT